MKNILLILSLFLSCLTYAQPVRVSKRAHGFDRNPTLFYQGVAGGGELSSLVGKYLKNCGWFDIVGSGGSAEYKITGTADDAVLTLTLTDHGVESFRVKAPVSSNNAAAAKAVDAILRKLFKIDGICNSKIAFCAATGRSVKNIYLTDINGSTPRQITKFRSLSVEPCWTPDGKSIVYTFYGKGSTDIVQTNISPLRSRRLASFRGLNSGAAVSPNGKYLAMIMSRDDMVELYVKSFSGSAFRRLTKSRAAESSPCWSPGGGTLCFVSGISGRPNLYIIGANGGKMQKIPTLGSEAVAPDWSKDGKIVYAARMGSEYTIAVYDPKNRPGSGIIVRAAGSWESPHWAPDNRHVVCSRTLNRRSSIYIIDTWTGKARQLLATRQNLSMPCWSNN